MDDGIRGSLIIVIGFTIAVLVSLVREKRKGTGFKKSSITLFILWMVICAVYAVYKFLNL